MGAEGRSGQLRQKYVQLRQKKGFYGQLKRKYVQLSRKCPIVRANSKVRRVRAVKPNASSVKAYKPKIYMH